MSYFFKPGDQVVCIRNRLKTTQPPLGLVVGRLYVIDAVGVTDAQDSNPGVPWVRLRGVSMRADKLGFRASWFSLLPRSEPEFAVAADEETIRRGER